MLALRRAQRLVSISMGPRVARLPRFVARVYAWRNRKLDLGRRGEKGLGSAASCSDILDRPFYFGWCIRLALFTELGL